MNKLKIQHIMTASRYTIAHDQLLRAAHRMMSEHDIRHLPVLDGGRLVGVVSQRHLHLIESLGAVDLDEVAVSEVMSSDVFTVGARANLDRTVFEMARRKLGTAVVIDRNAVVGVFTVGDALGVLLQWLEQQQPDASASDLA